MSGEAKKLHLIEEILKIEDDEVLRKVEIVIQKNKTPSNRTSFKQFAGMMSIEEADDLEKLIEGGCETVNLNDWK